MGKKLISKQEQIKNSEDNARESCIEEFSSNLEKKGVPMEQIARLAGHSRITTTDGYLHTDMATLSNAVAVLNENKS